MAEEKDWAAEEMAAEEARYRKAKRALLETGLAVDILRRDEESAERRRADLAALDALEREHPLPQPPGSH
jgi:hypothetical protein